MDIRGNAMDKRLIYLDNAATTRVLPEVVQAMVPYFSELYGNPSAIYDFAGEAKKAVDDARTVLAGGIHAKSNEIFFTAGGSESDNWAVKGIAEAYAAKGKHIITTAIEHHAVLNTCEYLEQQGFEVSYIGVDQEGRVKLDELRAAIRPDTILISVMAANNEVGTIQPLQEIGELAKSHDCLFHTDAVQAYGHIPLDMDTMKIDLLSASGHKLHGPKGVGFLYIRKGVKLPSFIHGGAQERGRRAGTLNVPGIVGFGKAAELSFAHMEEWSRNEQELTKHMIQRVLTEIPDSHLNGSAENRLPNNASFVFEGIERDSMLILLDQYGICVSGGSACASGSVDDSHVLTAMGISHELSRGALRLSLSHETTKEEVDIAVDALKDTIERLRSFQRIDNRL